MQAGDGEDESTAIEESPLPKFEGHHGKGYELSLPHKLGVVTQAHCSVLTMWNYEHLLQSRLIMKIHCSPGSI